jgi:hypothetical protein
MVIVEKLVEWRLAGEIEVRGENLPQRHFVHHNHEQLPEGTVAYSVGYFTLQELYRDWIPTT